MRILGKQLICLILYQNLLKRFSQASYCAKTSFPLIIGGSDCNFAITALDVDYSGNIISGGSTNDYYSLGNGLGLQSSICTLNTNQVPFVKYQYKGGSEKWSKFFTSAISQYYFNQVVDVKFYPSSSSSPNSAFIISLLQPLSGSGRTAIVIQNTIDGHIIASKLFATGTGLNFISSIFLQQINSGLSSEYLKIQTLRASITTDIVGNKLQTFTSFTFNPSTQILISNPITLRSQNTNSYSQRVHCDQYSNKCYTVIAKNVGSNVIKYDIGYFESSTGQSKFYELGSDTSSKFVLFKNSVQINKDRFLFIGSYYDWTTQIPADTGDGPVILIVNLNQCTVSTAFDFQFRRLSLTRKITMIDAQVSNAIISGSTETVKVTFAYAGDYQTSTSPSELDVFILDYEIQYDVTTCGQTYTGTFNIWEIDQRYTSSNIPFSIDGGVLQFIGSGIYVLAFGQGKNYYVKYSNIIINYSKNVGFIDMFGQTKGDINLVKCSADNLNYNSVSRWDFWGGDILSYTGINSSLAILSDIAATQIDINDFSGNPSYLLTANDFYDSNYQTAQYQYQFTGASSQWCSTNTAFSPQPYQMSIKTGVTQPYLYLNGQGIYLQDLNLGSLLFNPITMTTGQTCSNSNNYNYQLRTVSQSGVAGLVSTGCTSSNFQTFFSFNKLTGVLTNIKATDSTINNCEFIFNILWIADNLQNVAYLNFKLRILDCNTGVSQMATTIVSQSTFSTTDDIQFIYQFAWGSSFSDCFSASNFLFYKFDCSSSSQTAITLYADPILIISQYAVSEVPGLILGTKTTNGTSLQLKYFARQSQILDKTKIQSVSLTEIKYCLAIQVTLSGTPGFSRYYYQPFQIVLTCPTLASNIAINNAGLPKIILNLNAVQSQVITTSLTGIFSSFSQCSLIYFIDLIQQDITLQNLTLSYLTNQNIFLSDQVPNLKVDPQFNITQQVKVYIKACLADPVTTPLSCTSSVAAASVQIEIPQQCATTTITEPTGFITSQIFLISSAIPQFTFNQFTSSISGCPITSVEALNIDGSVSSVFDSSVNGLGNYVQIISTQSQVKGNYNFILKATAQGGVTLSTIQTFNLIVECGPSSTSLIVPVGFSTLDQTFLIDQATRPYYFFPSNFTSSVPACAITTITLIDQASGTLNIFFDINLQSNLTGSYFQILSTYMLQVNTILLRIQITFDGGRSEIVTKNGVSIFKLQVSCGPISNTLTTPTIINQNFTIQQGIQPSFKFDNFIESNSNCPIISYSAFKDDLSAYLTTLGATSVFQGIQQAFVVDVLQQYSEQTYIFKIKVSVTGGQIYYTASTYSLCVQNLTVPTNATNLNLTLIPSVQNNSSGINYKDFNIPPYLNFEENEIFSKISLDQRNSSIVLKNEIEVIVLQNERQIFIFPEIQTFDFDEIPILEQTHLNILSSFSQLIIMSKNELQNNYDNVIFINSSNLKMKTNKQYQLIFQFSENIAQDFIGKHFVSWQLQSIIIDKISGNKSLGSSFTQYNQKISFVHLPAPQNIQNDSFEHQKSMDSNQTFFQIQVQDVDQQGYAIIDFNVVKLVLKNLSLVSNKSIEFIVEVSQENKDMYQFKKAKRNLGFNDSQFLTNFQYEQIEYESLQIPNFYLINIWECVVFSESYMKVKLNFSDPDFLSIIIPDTLKLKILNEQIFERQPQQNLQINYEKYIYRGFTSRSKIRKNNPQNYDIQEDLSTITMATQIIICSNIILNSVMYSSLSQVFGFVNSLQIILHYPLIKQSISLPYEVQAFYSNAIQIAQFDYIPYNYSTALLFEFNEPDFDYYELGQFQNLNYEDYSTIINLGSNFYYLCILAIYTIFVMVLLIFQKIMELKDQDCKNVREFVKKQKEKLMNVVPSYFIEGTFEILIACYLNWQEPIGNQKLELKNDKNYFQGLVQSFYVVVSRIYFFANDHQLTLGDRLSFFSVFPIVLIILLFVPAYLIKLTVSFYQTETEIKQKDQKINKNFDSENLEKKQNIDYKKKKSEKEPPLELQKDMRCNHYYQRAFFLLFILRRLFFILIVIQFNKNTQLCLMMFLNLLQTIYVSSAKNYIFKKYNTIQIYNELVISFTIYMTLVFTDYVEYQYCQNLVGNILLYVVIGFNFLINFLLSGMSLFHKIQLAFQKVKNKLCPQQKQKIEIDSEKDIPSSVFIMKKLNKVQNLSEQKKEQPTQDQIKSKLQIIYKAVQNKNIIQVEQQDIQKYKPASFQNLDESTKRKIIQSQSRSLKSAQKLNKKIAKESVDKSIKIVPQDQLAQNKIARTQRQLAKELNMSVIQEAKEPEQTFNFSLQNEDLNIFYPGQKVNKRITKGENKGKLQNQ